MGILSWEYVNVRFTPTESGIRPGVEPAGEIVPSNTLENGVCRACGSMACYDKERKAVRPALVN